MVVDWLRRQHLHRLLAGVGSAGSAGRHVRGAPWLVGHGGDVGCGGAGGRAVDENPDAPASEPRAGAERSARLSRWKAGRSSWANGGLQSCTSSSARRPAGSSRTRSSQPARPASELRSTAGGGVGRQARSAHQHPTARACLGSQNRLVRYQRLPECELDARRSGCR